MIIWNQIIASFLFNIYANKRFSLKKKKLKNKKLKIMHHHHHDHQFDKNEFDLGLVRHQQLDFRRHNTVILNELRRINQTKRMANFKVNEGEKKIAPSHSSSSSVQIDDKVRFLIEFTAGALGGAVSRTA